MTNGVRVDEGVMRRVVLAPRLEAAVQALVNTALLDLRRLVRHAVRGEVAVESEDDAPGFVERCALVRVGKVGDSLKEDLEKFLVTDLVVDGEARGGCKVNNLRLDDCGGGNLAVDLFLALLFLLLLLLLVFGIFCGLLKLAASSNELAVAWDD